MTPEGKVKEDVHAILKSTGLVKTGVRKHLRPSPTTGWYYMPVQNGMGVTGIPDFIGHYRSVFFAIETKAPGKLDNLSGPQEDRRDEIMCTSGSYFLTDDAAQFSRDWRAWTGHVDAHLDAAQEGNPQPT